jgi:DNA-directed RNA polymerase subunit N (RpoN/RPB10)
MIIPMNCFTCGRPIAHQWEDYLQSVKKFESLGRVEKSSPEFAKLSGKTDLDLLELVGNKTPEFLALADNHIGRHCCRRMFLCQHDMYDKVR